MNEDELKSLNLILGFIECILSNETNENRLNKLLACNLILLVILYINESN